MRRICLCLLIAFASTGVVAREVRLLSAEDSCPEAGTHKPGKTKAGPVRDATPPAREPRARPSLHSDSAPGGLGKPRWHSFLPGMFR